MQDMEPRNILVSNFFKLHDWRLTHRYENNDQYFWQEMTFKIQKYDYQMSLSLSIYMDYKKTCSRQHKWFLRPGKEKYPDTGKKCSQKRQFNFQKRTSFKETLGDFRRVQTYPITFLSNFFFQKLKKVWSVSFRHKNSQFLENNNKIVGKSQVRSRRNLFLRRAKHTKEEKQIWPVKGFEPLFEGYQVANILATCTIKKAKIFATQNLRNLVSLWKRKKFYSWIA